LPDVRVVPDVLQERYLPVVVDGDVVEHLLSFGAVEDHVDRAAGRRIRRVVEVQAHPGSRPLDHRQRNRRR
jgi:hypothetical protein